MDMQDRLKMAFGDLMITQLSLGDTIEKGKAANDALTKENAELKAKLEALAPKEEAAQ